MRYLLLVLFISIATQMTFSMGMAPLQTSPVPGGNHKMTCMALTPQCMGNSSGTRPSDYCVNCQYLSQPNWRFNVMRPQQPWWYPYGYYAYPNFQRPGAWYNNGLSHHYYPGGGNMVAGKPNIYFHGLDKDTTFHVKFKKEASLLAASPLQPDDGWMLSKVDGTPNKKHMEKGISFVNVDGVNHDYIYYDYKLDSSSLQSEKGFCGDRADTFAAMVSILNQMKFKDKEVSDFETYWSVKLPKGNFCVYPQTHEQLQSIAEWNSSTPPTFFKRVLFVVVPEKIIGEKVAANFKSRPTMGWNPLSGVYRLPASQGTFQVHEWGVAFLATNKKK
jgi:hypothetical protein